MSFDPSFPSQNAWKQAGDREKFAYLYQNYQSYMYQVAFSLLFNSTLAEDAVQEAFLKLIHYLDSVDEEDTHRTKGYIKAIVQTTALHMLKRSKKEFLYERHLLEELSSEKAASPEIQFLGKDLAGYLRQFIGELKPKEQHCIYLFYFKRQSTLQIAESLGVSPAAVRKRLQRGREALRKHLEKEGLL